jgi:hypothetical protein
LYEFLWMCDIFCIQQQSWLRMHKASNNRIEQNKSAYNSVYYEDKNKQINVIQK